MLKVDDLFGFLNTNSFYRLQSLYEKAARNYFSDVLPKLSQTRKTTLERVDSLLIDLIFTTEKAAPTERSAYNNYDRVTANAIACHELMIWAVLMHDTDLAEFFWQSGGIYLRIQTFSLLYSHII